MNTWLTADQHFGHANIIKYCNRPFGSVEEMDEEMIKRWNEVVKEGDLVYHLGDFTLGDIDAFYAVCLRLNGTIKIIPGGHDHRWLKEYADADIWLNVIKTKLCPALYSIKLNRPGKHSMPLVMCHYPMRSWDRSHYGAPHAHGHCHGTIGVRDQSMDTQLPPGQDRGVRVDVGVDCWDFYPIHMRTFLEFAGVNNVAGY